MGGGGGGGGRKDRNISPPPPLHQGVAGNGGGGRAGRPGGGCGWRRGWWSPCAVAPSRPVARTRWPPLRKPCPTRPRPTVRWENRQTKGVKMASLKCWFLTCQTVPHIPVQLRSGRIDKRRKLKTPLNVDFLTRWTVSHILIQLCGERIDKQKKLKGIFKMLICNMPDHVPHILVQLWGGRIHPCWE